MLVKDLLDEVEAEITDEKSEIAKRDSVKVLGLDGPIEISLELVATECKVIPLADFNFNWRDSGDYSVRDLMKIVNKKLDERNNAWRDEVDTIDPEGRSLRGISKTSGSTDLSAPKSKEKPNGRKTKKTHKAKSIKRHKPKAPHT